MKKFSISIFALIAFSFAGISQDLKYKTEAEYLKKTYGKDKKELLEGYLELDEQQGKIFWPLYEEYEAKRKKLGEARWEKFQIFNETHDAIDDPIADRWLDTVFVFRQQYLSLLEDFSINVQSKLGSMVAMQTYEFEAYIRAGTRKYLTERAAFVGEGFVKKK